MVANEKRICYPHRVVLRTCKVSVLDIQEVEHSVEVSAETLYEAAAQGLGVLTQSEWADVIGPGTELRVTVKNPETTH